MHQAKKRKVVKENDLFPSEILYKKNPYLATLIFFGV